MFSIPCRGSIALSLTLAGALLVGPFQPGASAHTPELEGLDEYIEKALEDWEVPGLGLAIVREDEILHSRGYGVTRLGGEEPVDAETVFAIGSASKAFTTAALSMLVEDGKLDWEDRVTDHLPGFELSDPYVTRQLTVRDLVTHRSGLPRGDLLWYGSDFDREEILNRVRLLEPTTSFRSTFGYQNILYLVAGMLIPQLTDASWDTFLREEFFFPLGMISTGTSIVDLQVAYNVASPHARIDEKVAPVAWRDIHNMAPAGSINSNARDMAQWIRLQLGEGKYKGRSILENTSIAEMHRPQTVIRKEGRWALFFSEANFLNYGLGWFLHDYRGKKVVEHGGNIDGMSALVALVPEEELGLVILTNLGGNLLPSALRNRIFDLLLEAPPKRKTNKEEEPDQKETADEENDKEAKDESPGASGSQDEEIGEEPGEKEGEAHAHRDREHTEEEPEEELRDWSAEYQTLFRVIQGQRDSAQKELEAGRVEGTKPSVDPKLYVGTYTHPMYGDVEILSEEAGLVLRRGSAFVGDLKHWHQDTFRIHWRDRILGKGMSRFFLTPKGEIEAVEIVDFDRFDRKPPEEPKPEPEEEEEFEDDEGSGPTPPTSRRPPTGRRSGRR